MLQQNSFKGAITSPKVSSSLQHNVEHRKESIFLFGSTRRERDKKNAKCYFGDYFSKEAIERNLKIKICSALESL